MTNSDLSKIDLLYRRYGYVLKKESSDSSIRVYTLNKGIYFGADIIYSRSDFKNNTRDKIQSDLSKAGYGCRQIEFIDVKTIEKTLFKVFFRPEALKIRLQDRYQKFCHTQSKQLGSESYKYINAPFHSDSVSSTETIIDTVMEHLVSEGSKLIIIEAAAGFGKTCTSYELVNRLSSNNCEISPIFTELSRDRRAAIFKHILDDVIINEFHSLLDEALVTNEIISGNIPLIIDGFDELLSKEQDIGSDDFQQVETMLSTIGELLHGNSKIILTGRKTAIFSGDSFQEWINNSDNKFSVHRYLINPPRVKDWLTPDQLEKINTRKIPIKEIANPVLLSFMRSTSSQEFESIISDPSKLVDKYFNSILEREQERQDLRIEPNLQLNIFERLTSSMIDFDIMSDTREWIRTLIEEHNKTYLEEVRKSYPAAQRPTMDEMTNTLANHALLDRKGNNDNIGFVNDFIFGTFIGNVLIDEKKVNFENVSKHMLELSTTAFQFQNLQKKQRLLNKLVDYKEFTMQERLQNEYLLNTEITGEFHESSFADMSLTNVKFNVSTQFQTCVFVNCTFNDSLFATDAFFETSFINCVFKDCELDIDITKEEFGITFINCNDYDSGFLQSFEKPQNEATPDENYDNLYKKVLTMYLKIGSYSPRYRRISQVVSEFSGQDRAIVSGILKDLQTNSLIKVNGDNSFLSDEGIKAAQENKLS